MSKLSFNSFESESLIWNKLTAISVTQTAQNPDITLFLNKKKHTILHRFYPTCEIIYPNVVHEFIGFCISGALIFPVFSFFSDSDKNSCWCFTEEDKTNAAE